MVLAPPAPTNVTISEVQPNQFTVTWDAADVSEIYKFEVNYGVNYRSMKKSTIASRNPPKSMILTDLKSNSKYVVFVKFLSETESIASDISLQLYQITSKLSLGYFCIYTLKK